MFFSLCVAGLYGYANLGACSRAYLRQCGINHYFSPISLLLARFHGVLKRIHITLCCVLTEKLWALPCLSLFCLAALLSYILFFEREYGWWHSVWCTGPLQFPFAAGFLSPEMTTYVLCRQRCICLMVAPVYHIATVYINLVSRLSVTVSLPFCLDVALPHPLPTRLCLTGLAFSLCPRISAILCWFGARARLMGLWFLALL